MNAARLQQWFPWTKGPVICNGPMLGVATAELASEVTKAGGLGFLPCAGDFNPASAHLTKLDADLAKSKELLGTTSAGTIPVGAGLLTLRPSAPLITETTLPLIEKHRPAAVWLFAPGEAIGNRHDGVIKALRAMSEPRPKVLVQVGNVQAAREAVEDGADALVCQGVDAGGHQYRRGVGVVSLLPEVREMLEREFQGRDIAVLAAGGIVNGKGAAAGLALGAEGIVMGTRFTVTPESAWPDMRKQIALRTVDAGRTTLKSGFNDDIANNPWGPLYDGRAVIGEIHQKFLAGATLEECHESLKKDYPSEKATEMVNTWAGAGVGMVNDQKPAAQIVEETRAEARAVITRLAQGL